MNSRLRAGTAAARGNCQRRSPFAKRNYVDNTFTDQSSIVRFIEDNWLGGSRIGNGSADADAGTLANMFDWRSREGRRLFLDPSTGQPTQGGWGH
ncbi:MAG: hypothetical protein ACJ780_16495 [Solirubrobacteraceae bacterium]